MERCTRAIFRTVTILAFVGVFLATHLVAQSQSRSIWQIQHPPFSPTDGLSLNAISAQSDQNVWAVGHSSVHWDGHAWTLVPIIQRGEATLNLTGVAALSPSNISAVGSFVNSQGRARETVERFDGKAWHVIPDVNLIGQNLQGIVDNEALTSISALAPNDVWAAGYVGIQPPCDCIVPFIEHFDGTQWNLSGVLLTANSAGHFQFLEGIGAISPSDVWAVGFISENGALNGVAQAFHFDGTQWTLASAPGGQAARFNAVAAVASDDVWAVGENNQKTLIEHFDGKQWQLVKSPNTKDLNNLLFGVTAVSGHSVWAVGQHYNDEGSSLVLHFDGSRWSISPAPSEGDGSHGTLLFGATGLPSGHVWLGGTFLAKHIPPLRPFVLFTRKGQ